MKQFFILFLILNIFDYSKAVEEFCPALGLVCKTQVTEKNTDKVIRRWLDKIRSSPLCFIGGQSETIHHEDDNTFEVIRLSKNKGIKLNLRRWSSNSSLTSVWPRGEFRGWSSSWAHYKVLSRYYCLDPRLTSLNLVSTEVVYICFRFWLFIFSQQQ